MMGDAELLRELLVEVRSRANKLLDASKAAGILLRVTSGYRTWKEQDRLYAQGRTAPGLKVTNARGGHSWHNMRRAFDVWPVGVQAPSKELWREIGLLGEAAGLEWGGRWESFYDPCHFQWTDGLTIAQARELWESAGDPLVNEAAILRAQDP